MSTSVRLDRKVVHERLSSLIWRCLDNDLVMTAHFYAERLFAFDGSNHEARHLLATATLRLNQPHSALHLVTRPRDDQCAGCYEIAAKCSAALGRHSKARTLLEHSIVLFTTSPISMSIRDLLLTLPRSLRLQQFPRTTHNTRRVHSSRCSLPSLPLGYPRCKGLPHLRSRHQLYPRSPTRAPPMGGMDRPLCTRYIQATIRNPCIIYLIAYTPLYRREH